MRTRENQLTKKLSRRLLLVDDHPIMREGFARVIDHEPDLKVCGQSDNAAKALEDIAVLKPDLVIVDIALKGVNGIDPGETDCALHPETPSWCYRYRMKHFSPNALFARAPGAMS